MAIRERMCAECGGQFSYEIGRGKDRLFCGSRCSTTSTRRSQAEALRGKLCVVDRCGKTIRSSGCEYCEMHYGRLRRSGTLGRVDGARRLEHSAGYVLIPARDHPMAVGRSHAYEHRVAFFDAHGPGPHRCHVCGEAGMLADMHVDHLNDVHDDNRLENLKPACPECNQWRSTTRAEACRKKEATRLIDFNGERLSTLEWSRRIGISSTSLRARINSGWTLERALTEPRGVTGPQRTRA